MGACQHSLWNLVTVWFSLLWGTKTYLICLICAHRLWKSFHVLQSITLAMFASYWDVVISHIPLLLIAKHQLLTLWSWLPPAEGVKEPLRVFTTNEHGYSLKTLYEKVEEYGPTLIVLRTVDNDVSICVLYYIVMSATATRKYWQIHGQVANWHASRRAQTLFLCLFLLTFWQACVSIGNQIIASTSISVITSLRSAKLTVFWIPMWRDDDSCSHNVSI